MIIMENYALQAIKTASIGEKVFCKFLSANDTGVTGGHQSGIYISKPAIPILFDSPGKKGENKEKWVKIKWQDDFETSSRFIYYGQGTRNEYRITNFGRAFPFLSSEYTGALFVLIQHEPELFSAYLLNTEDEIDLFLNSFNISPTETNRLINISQPESSESRESEEIKNFIANLSEDFPDSEHMSYAAQTLENKIYNQKHLIYSNPDQKLISWTSFEFKLFRALENARYSELIANGFDSVDTFISIANQVLNRRKSRAGKSLEHHLSTIFNYNDLQYQAQVVTEGNKRPDFLFPSQEAYKNLSFPVEKLITLAAKTTCKDRWRQILNEANRLKGQPKFLCTLQQGISETQLKEMQEEQVILVVPKQYISSFPKKFQDEVWSLHKFIQYVKEKER